MQVNINQLSKLYHLRRAQRDRQRLLDASLHEAIEEHLEFALTELGIDADEEVCLRLVQVPLCFNFGQSQSATSLHWSNIIGRHIRHELDRGGANVVRFRSRLHALLAFAEDVSLRQMQRSWAWNQLGLADLRMDSNLEQARIQLVSALLREPAAAGAVIARFAAQQSLLGWLRELSIQDRHRLLDGILAEAGVERRWLEVKPSLVEADEYLPASVLSDAGLAGSKILNHLLAHAARPTRQQRQPPGTVQLLQTLQPRAWVILILLELEPLLFRRADSVVATAIAAVEKILLPVLTADPDRGSPAPGRPSTPCAAPDTPSRAANRAAQHALQAAENPTEVASQAPRPAVNGVTGSTARTAEVATGSVGAGANPGIGSTDTNRAHPAGPDSPVRPGPVPEQAEEPLAAPQFFSSEFGGLLLLLPLLAETSGDDAASLIDRMIADQAFDARPLSWVLYRLTNLWLPIAPDDPALRAFCGIDIDSEWPWPADDTPTPRERSALTRHAASIEARLGSKLSSGASDSSFVIGDLCRRYAKLFIDSGWLEMVFDLNQVDTDIRRAGLDLDPGFVPWLGKVVKIRYE